jgi:KTSC domain
VKIRSTNIAEAEHAGEVLTVKFHSGRTYVYTGVKESLYRAFLGARSKGAFLNRWIKSRRDIKVQEIKHK